jgi:hypothetical protein
MTCIQSTAIDMFPYIFSTLDLDGSTLNTTYLFTGGFYTTAGCNQPLPVANGYRHGSTHVIGNLLEDYRELRDAYLSNEHASPVMTWYL